MRESNQSARLPTIVAGALSLAFARCSGRSPEALWSSPVVPPVAVTGQRRAAPRTSYDPRMSFVVRLLVNAAALWVATRLVPGVTYSGGWIPFFGVALMFGFVNAFIRPV